MDVTLVLDLSGSVEMVYDVILAFAKKLVEGLPVSLDRGRVGLVSFRDEAEVNFFLDTYRSKEEILNALAFSQAGGKTNTQSAVRQMYSDVFTAARGDRNGVDNIAVVVSDGGSNINQGNTLVEAAQARSRGIDIYSVAIGENPDMAEVNGIATDPDSDFVLRMRGATEVEQTANDLLDRLCQ